MLHESPRRAAGRAADDPGAARGPSRPARRRRANGARGSRGRGRGLPPRCRPGAGARRAAADVPADRTRPQGVRSGPIAPQLEGEDGFRFHHLLLREATYDAIPKTARVRAPRAVRRLARTARRGPGRLRRLPPRTGLPLPRRASLDTGPRPTASRCGHPSCLERAATAALGRSDRAAAIGLLERAAAPSARPGPAARPAPDRSRRHAHRRRRVRRGEPAFSTRRRCWRRRRTTSGRPARALVERQFLELRRASPGATDAVPEIVEQRDPDLRTSRRRARSLPRLAASGVGRLEPRPHLGGRRRVGTSGRARRPGRGAARTGRHPLLARLGTHGSARCPSRRASVRCEELQREVAATRPRRPRSCAGSAGSTASQADSSSPAPCSPSRTPPSRISGGGCIPCSPSPRLSSRCWPATSRPPSRACAKATRSTKRWASGQIRSTTAAFARSRDHGARTARRGRAVHRGAARSSPSRTISRRRSSGAGVRARLLAARGGFAEAEQLAREAVTLAESTEFVNFHADALIDLAAVLEADSRTAEAVST